MQDTFSCVAAYRITGITVRQLGYWDKTGLIQPSASTGEGYARRIQYDFRDLAAIRCVATLLEADVSLQKCRKVVEYVQRLKKLDSARDALASTKLVVIGGDVIALNGDEIVSALVAPGQLLVPLIVPFGAIITDLQKRLAKAA